MRHVYSTQVNNFLKKLFITFLSIFIFSFSYSQCGNLYISGVIDGPLSGGTPKAIKLCATGDIADLSLYGLGVANNGGGSDGQEFTFPADSLTSGDCIWVAHEGSNPGSFNAFFGFNATYIDPIINVNGDDAAELYCSGAVVDVIGEVCCDGTGSAWEYLDGWAYSCDDVANPIFDQTEWTFSGPNALDGETSNATAATPFPSASYVCATYDCPLLSLNFGDSCDDGDATTSNDVVDSLCVCAGTPTGSSVCQVIDSASVTSVDVAVNSDGDVWNISAAGFSMNGYCGGGCAEFTDNWLILGDLDLTMPVADLELVLSANENFGTTDLGIFYSTSFTGCPGDAANNWTSVGTITSGGTGLSYSLGTATGSNVVLGIQYQDDGADGYSSWFLSDIELVSASCPAYTPNTTPCYNLPCSISGLSVFNESCNGTDYILELAYTLTNPVDFLGGVVIEDITNSQVISTSLSSPTTISFPNNLSSSTFDIIAYDATDPSCASDTLTITTLNCSPVYCSSPGDLIITEFMNNPDTVTDSFGEYFEIYNNTASPIDIFGHIISDSDNDSHQINSSVIIAANSYAVLSNNSDFATNGGVVVDYQYSDNWFLSNSGDEIIISCNGTIIDSVGYNGSYPSSAGVSAELCSDSLDAASNDNVSAWIAATSAISVGDLGTPGSAGESCAPVACQAILNISGSAGAGQIVEEADDIIFSTATITGAAMDSVIYCAGNSTATANTDLIGTSPLAGEFIELQVGFDADGTRNFYAKNTDCDDSDD